MLDTNVLVAALRSPSGASARLIEAMLQNRFVMVANAALFIEYESVLTRPEHLLPAGRSASQIVAALDEIASKVDRAERRFSWRPQMRDADDEMVLEAAVNGRADAIITFETRTFKAAAARFGVSIMTPREIWVRLRP